jgi:hypothetical protein
MLVIEVVWTFPSGTYNQLQCAVYCTHFRKSSPHFSILVLNTSICDALSGLTNGLNEVCDKEGFNPKVGLE